MAQVSMEWGLKTAARAIPPPLKISSIKSITNQDRLKQTSLLIQLKNPAESSINKGFVDGRNYQIRIVHAGNVQPVTERKSAKAAVFDITNLHWSDGDLSGPVCRHAELKTGQRTFRKG